MSDTTFSSAEQSGVFGRAVAAFRSGARRFSDYRRFRQTVNQLSELGDRELRDLGLERSSLRSVAHEAVYQDR